MHRFRDSEGNISLDLPINEKQMSAKVAELFEQWVLDGMLPHDFIDWITHEYYSNLYDYVVAKALS